jgi:hypothetical protein
MPAWDGIGTPVQLGGDLTVNDAGTVRIGWYDGSSPRGFDFNAGDPPNVSVWDWRNPYTSFGPQQDQFVPGPSTHVLDMCVHAGELHVIWCELKGYTGDNDAEYLGPYVMGPYVKKWNGSAWVQLGSGSIDDSAYAEMATLNSRYSPNGQYFPIHPWLPPGERTYPGRPRICSDGTNLFAAYTMHVNSPAADPPLNGDYWQGDPYGVVVPGNGAHDRWYSRNVLVRRWNGSTWELWAEIQATTNNDPEQNGAQNGQFMPRLELVADAGEPGVCYVAWSEGGFVQTNVLYIRNPIFFVGFVFGTNVYSDWNDHLFWARCDGGAPTIKTVASRHGVESGGITVGWTFTGDAYDVIHSQVRLLAHGGDCYMFWTSELLRFSDMANLRTATVGILPNDAPGQLNPSEAIWDSNNNDAYVALQELTAPKYYNLYEDPLDGTQPDLIDGSAAPIYVYGSSTPTPNPSLPVPLDRLADDEPNNVWANGWNQRDPAAGAANQDIWIYHRPCRAWNQLAIWHPDTTPNYFYSNTALVRIGAVLYLACIVYTPGLDAPSAHYATQWSVRVYEIPIVRFRYSCGGPAAPPYLKGRVQIKNT